MIDALVRWWRSQQLRRTLIKGNRRDAAKQLQSIRRSKTNLSWWEALFLEVLQLQQQNTDAKKQLAKLRQKLRQSYASRIQTFIPNPEIVRSISQMFSLREVDDGMIQCTGIDNVVFSKLEKELSDYLKSEFERYSKDDLDRELQIAIKDLNKLQKGIDPNYDLPLSSHVYFLKYFIDNIYCLYLAWFLIYQNGQLPNELKILDIAAGPATSMFGLLLFLQRLDLEDVVSKVHVSYTSIEQQDRFQYRGLQFWRKYVQSISFPTNIFFQFHTQNLFDYEHYSDRVSEEFFNFIVISHCFFADPDRRERSNRIYRQIFRNHLKPGGWVLLVVQWTKLYRYYGIDRDENLQRERDVVQKFVAEELGLKPHWYRYLTSTGQRKKLKNFRKFSEENCSPQNQIGSLAQTYLGLPYRLNYSIDDYVILAQFKD
ncbi:MAG: photosystem II assembly protein [Cyanobacteria bacterium SID2]|nr:photosystem II assembly protein [Cyanobacteria bacterium SID2]